MTNDQAFKALIIGILALVSLVPVTAALRHARAFGDWDLTSTLVLLTGLLANVPSVAYVLRAGRVQRLDPLGEVEIGFPQWVNRIGTVSNAVLLLACVAFVVHRVLFARVRVNTAPLVALALVVLFALSDGLHGQQLLVPRQLVLFAVLLVGVVARPGRPAFLGAAAAVLLFSVLGGVEALVEPATVLRECRADNPCGLLGIHYAGVFSNENIFGMMLVLGIPFVWLGLRGRVRCVLVGYVALLAVATGSTMSGVAAIATVALLALLRPGLPGDTGARTAPGRVLVTVPILLTVAAVGLALPFNHPSPDRLGDRATIWRMAGAELPASPFVGFGGKTWSAKYPAGEIPAAVSPSLHNQWIDVLYAGGLVGLALFLLLLLHLLARGGVPGFPAAAVVLLPVLLTSVLERPWSFGISNALTFALLAAVLIPGSVGRAAPPAAPGSGSSPAAVPARTPDRRPAATGPGR
ncbi:O-antigen ligase family protein [Streptomyces sp. NPDC005574]|uniref:O-antigen ligase family protein n=1 Tax=Streptomyces sp. NPDC005574 TaxID=3156891 RepID=UPI0033B5B4AF